MTNITMPEEIRYYTADTCAETLPLKPFESSEVQALMRKLWSFVDEAKNPTPLGGDGSNGTVETPDGRLSLDNDDKPQHWWNRLTDAEAQLIVDAVEREFGPSRIPRLDGSSEGDLGVHANRDRD